MNSEIYVNFKKVLQGRVPKQIDFSALSKMAKEVSEDAFFRQEILSVLDDLSQTNNYYKVFIMVSTIFYTPIDTVVDKISLGRILRVVADKISVRNIETRKFVLEALYQFLCYSFNRPEKFPIDGRILKNISIMIEKRLKIEKDSSIKELFRLVQAKITYLLQYNETLSFKQLNQKLVETLNLPEEIESKVTDKDREDAFAFGPVLGFDPVELIKNMESDGFVNVKNQDRHHKILELQSGLYREDYNRYIAAMNNPEQDMDLAFIACAILTYNDDSELEWAKIVYEADNPDKFFKAYLNFLKVISLNQEMIGLEKVYKVYDDFFHCLLFRKIKHENFHEELRSISKDVTASSLLRLFVRKFLIEIEIEQALVDMVLNAERLQCGSNIIDSIMSVAENPDSRGFLQVNLETGQTFSAGCILADSSGMRLQGYAFYAKEDGELDI